MLVRKSTQNSTVYLFIKKNTLPKNVQCPINVTQMRLCDVLSQPRVHSFLTKLIHHIYESSSNIVWNTSVLCECVILTLECRKLFYVDGVECLGRRQRDANCWPPHLTTETNLITPNYNTKHVQSVVSASDTSRWIKSLKYWQII